MSSCRHVSAMLDAHVDGELSPEQAVTVDAHAADCSSCGRCERACGARSTRRRHRASRSKSASRSRSLRNASGSAPFRRT